MEPKEKRKRVMRRSIKLGHCVCDPRKPCPCPLFKEKNICTCAGERVPTEDTGKQVRLTEYVRSAGCASKIGQKDLHQVLNQLPSVNDPRLLVGTATADDAGVFKLTPDVTVVQTVDVFTPGVDDPKLFGRIAACNSLSDVYAMGGTPVTALSVIGFPIYDLAHEVMADIIKGGMEVLEEAGALLLGGHSINDEEIKFGFAVTGVIDTASLVTNAGARPGNALVLTKPLGTGIVSLANQIDRASQEAIEASSVSMSTLNRAASEIMVARHATACTDITGFGLLGHLCQMVTESGVTAELWWDSLPLLPNVLKYAEEGMFSGANERNAEYSVERTEFSDDISDAMQAIVFDAQTSGGLLMALPADVAEDAVAEMHEAGIVHAVVVGRITEESDGKIRIARSGNLGSTAKEQRSSQAEESLSTRDDGGCVHRSALKGPELKAFESYLDEALCPGAVDVVAKRLMAVSLALASKCRACACQQIEKATSMGVSKDELAEAASLAAAYGGTDVLTLWNEIRKEV